MAGNIKKLWIVTELFPPDETSTSYIMGEIANAMTMKYNVGVICGPEIYDRRKALDERNKFKLHESIEIHRTEGTGLDKNTTKGKALSFILMSLRLMNLVRKYVKAGDKVLMVTNPAPLVLLMAMLRMRKDFELNILVHDVFPENTRPAELKLPFYGLVKHLFDKSYGKADRLIALGRDMKAVLKAKVSKYNPDLHITVIENWADVENIQPRPFPTGKIVLEYAGNIGRVQGLDKVIERLPEDVELHIYGTGAMEDRLRAMNRGNVYFHGPYFRSQQTEVLASCDIALVTLQKGMYGLGVPSKTYNILASGRPILYLGPEGSEIDLLVKENGIGYCRWPERWDRNILSEMGANSRKLAETEYSKETILNKFLTAI